MLTKDEAEMKNKKNTPKQHKGQSLVEFAMSLLFLMVLLAGVVDLGRAYFTFVALRDAAQEGASYGAAFPTFCTQIRERIKTSSDTPVDLGALDDSNIDILISGVDCDIAVSLGLACTPNEIRVEVTMDDFPVTMPFMGSILGTQTLTLKADVADTIISNPCSGP
jgi:Flp pilus assembly protein TadG